MSVAAVIVTFNHRTLLEECLINIEALGDQLENIIVVDNASSDETESFMKQKASKNPTIQYVRLSENIGGSGGFNKGIRAAYDLGSDYVWIMDDDSMVNENSLSELLKAVDKVDNQFGFMASNVRWIDGKPSKMNVPKTITEWNDLADKGLIQINQGTFVSMLIKRECIADVGLPIKEFFIWGDDTEYSLRISEKYPSYFVSNSTVLHKMVENIGVDLVKETQRIPRYFYSFRNRYYIAKEFGGRKVPVYYAQFFLMFFRIIFKSKFKLKKLNVMFKGYFSALVFKPKIEKVD